MFKVIFGRYGRCWKIAWDSKPQKIGISFGTSLDLLWLGAGTKYFAVESVSLQVGTFLEHIMRNTNMSIVGRSYKKTGTGPRC